MNCVEFRRECLTALKPQSATFREHRQHCPACHGYHVRVQRLNISLEKALNVPVPPELRSRILLRHSFVRRRPRRALLAASVLVAAIGAGLWFNRPPMTPLQQEVLAHAMEPHVPAVSSPLPAAEVAQLVSQLGGELIKPIPSAVFYARRCRIAGHYAAHLLIDSPQGPVTVFLMPGSAAPRELVYREGHVETRVIPAGRGSIGLVAPNHVELQAVAEEVQAAIRWHA